MLEGVIKTDNPAIFFGIDTGAKQKILDFLTGIQKEDRRNWASINVIAKASKVSDIYTRTVLKNLCEVKVVECGRRDKKLYYRIIPKELES